MMGGSVIVVREFYVDIPNRVIQSTGDLLADLRRHFPNAELDGLDSFVADGVGYYADVCAVDQ